jgi:hypothetical protein
MAVLVMQKHVRFPQRAVRDRRRDRADPDAQARPVLGHMHQQIIRARPPDDLVRAAARQSLGRPIPVRDAPIEVEAIHAIVKLLQTC